MREARCGFPFVRYSTLYVKFFFQVHKASDFGVAVLQIEEAHLPVVLVIDGHDLRQCLAYLGEQRVVLDHLGDTVIAHELAVKDGQHFDFRVLRQLLVDVLERPAPEVDLAVHKQMEAKRAAFRLVAVGRQEIEDLGLIQIFVHFRGIRHDDSSLWNVLLWIFFSLFILSAWSMTTMFWLTGSCNYMWMSFFQLFFVTPYVKALRSHEAGNSALNVALMILLGLLAGWSNEAGSLATVCLTIFLVAMCKARGIYRSWMIAGLLALIVGCGFMILAPGNFARLAFAHPNFVYTEEIFFEHLTEGFDRVIGADLLALIPMFIYFLRRSNGSLNIPEILMLAFATAGLLVPMAMLFSPEFNSRVSVPSLAFVLVASTSAILEMERQNFKLNLQIPKKILRGVSAGLTSILVVYFLTFIYVDISIFNAARRQVRYIQRNAELDPVLLPPMPVRHRFEKIHGDRSAVPYLKFLAGVNENPNFCLNMLVAQYYGVKHVVGVND